MTITASDCSGECRTGLSKIVMPHIFLKEKFEDGLFKKL
jgi:hypothetical protein